MKPAKVADTAAIKRLNLSASERGRDAIEDVFVDDLDEAADHRGVLTHRLPDSDEFVIAWQLRFADQEIPGLGLITSTGAELRALDDSQVTDEIAEGLIEHAQHYFDNVKQTYEAGMAEIERLTGDAG